MLNSCQRSGQWGFRLLVMMVLLAGVRSVRAAETPAAEPAQIKVSGLGWWDDRQMRLLLERLLGESRGAELRANAVEDAVFLLMAALTEDGYLRPSIKTRILLKDGSQLDFTFDHELTTLLPRPMAATELDLMVTEGVRYTLSEINVEGGGEAIRPEKARLFFGFGSGLLFDAADQIYTPAKLKSARGRLEDELRRRGYAEAMVSTEISSVNHETGKVTVNVGIDVGDRWIIRSIVPPTEVPAGVVLPEMTVGSDQPWQAGWQQDIAQDIRQAYFQAGFPDVRISVLASPGEARGGIRAVQVILNVDSGEQVQVGEVRFEGATRTKPSVLRRRVDASGGDLLNPVKIEESRYRLARLGSFRRVEAEYDPHVGGVRDVVFKVQELPPWEASLLMGYGSYEQLRAGIELSQSNLWGTAHRSRLQLIHSFKGTRGDYTYTVPELFGQQLDGSVRLFGLQREEVAFERQEYGGTATLRRKLPWFGADGRLGYTFQSLQNTDNSLSTNAVDEDRTKVASIDVGLNRDRRDNPLRPRRGYRWFGQAELAASTLGGEVDYQRIEVGGSYHSAWGAGRWMHAGLTHGFVLTMGAPDDTSLPINKRFYPGGENDLRGFQDGEAAPRGADGSFIGAKTFLLLNLEVEQALTQSWSAIIFFDALGEAARLADYPFREKLYSAGLGLRYQTLIGPVRLEYGRNLNPRVDDPAGTLHFSVGFPF
jgi:outer membrane protein insertion porin family